MICAQNIFSCVTGRLSWRRFNMDFLTCVQNCTTNPSAGCACSWWNQLCVEANPAGSDDQKSAHALRLNVQCTELFVQNVKHKDDVALFCNALQSCPTG